MGQMYGISKEQRRAAVRKRVDQVAERLEKGWIYVEEHPGDEAAFALYLDLLREYEKWYFEWVTLGGKEDTFIYSNDSGDGIENKGDLL